MFTCIPSLLDLPLILHPTHIKIYLCIHNHMCLLVFMSWVFKNNSKGGKVVFPVVIYGCESWTIKKFNSVQFSHSVMSNSATPWTAAHQASLSITNSRSLLKLMSIESVMPFNHLILCHPLLLPPSIFPSIRVFSNESALCIRWPKYWSFSFNISPSNEHPGLISFRMNWLDLLAIQGALKHSVFCIYEPLDS